MNRNDLNIMRSFDEGYVMRVYCMGDRANEEAPRWDSKSYGIGK